MNIEREATAGSASIPLPGIVPNARRPQSWTKRQLASTVARAGAESRGATPSSLVNLDSIWPRDSFLHLLRREKRRADRTKSALSIVVFRPEGEYRNSPPGIARFLQIVASTVRETDVIGHLNGEAFAVMCPDTNETGTRRLVENVGKRCRQMTFSVQTACYPDHHFEVLAAGEWSEPETHPLFADAFSSTQASEYKLKRFLDVLGSLVAIVLFSPIMMATAIAVKLSSSGPIIFRQTRLGRFGIPFSFYKFRSMRINSDDSIHRQYVQSLIKGDRDKTNQETDTGVAPLYKLKSDPRITKVGRFIRKTSIDELPQFFNVLKGDMSLVGPRPPIPYEATDYQSWHLRRVLDIKPGITGLWQVEGRSRVSFDDMVRMDLRYMRICSLAVDMRILLKTAIVMLRGGDGAR